MSHKLCSICIVNVVDSVFIPCGHRFCCFDCSTMIERCGICRAYNKGYKTYDSGYEEEIDPELREMIERKQQLLMMEDRDQALDSELNKITIKLNNISDKMTKHQESVKKKQDVINNMNKKVNDLEQQIIRENNAVKEAELVAKLKQLYLQNRISSREQLRKRLKPDIVSLYQKYEQNDTNIKNMQKAFDKLMESQKCFKLYSKTDPDQSLINKTVHKIILKSNGNAQLSRRYIIKNINGDQIITNDPKCIIKKDDDFFYEF